MEATMGEVLGAAGGVAMKPRMQVDYMVYVGSPLSAPTPDLFEENLAYAERLCHEVFTKTGVVPYAPHLLFPRFLRDEDEEERWLGIGGGIVTLRRCNEAVLRLPEHLTSLTRGMAGEKHAAEEFHLPVTIVHSEEQWVRYLHSLRERALSEPLIRIG